MDFYQTQMGYKFYNNDLPRLINAMERIADSLESPSDKPAVYTHNAAADIVEMFEDVLGKEGIKLPSPEDDERDKDNGAALYGTVYADLLDNVENALKDLLERADAKAPIVTDIFE